MDKKINEPLVSVIITTYNRSYYLTRAVDSVLNQTWQNWELMIIDDGSTDNTGETAEKYLTNPRIKYIRQNHLGVSEARNRGIEESHGSYICLLDDDDEFLTNKIEVQLSLMQNSDAELSLSKGIIIYDGKKKKPPASSYDSFLVTKEDIFKRRFHISCSYFMFNCSIKDTYRFDPLLYGAVDFDFLVRVLGECKVLYIDQPLVYIHKSIKRNRISNDVEKKINTFQQLINKVNIYNWAEEEKLWARNIFYIRLGFWYMVNENYKEGRDCMRGLLGNLPLRKRIGFLFFYWISYTPVLFKFTKKSALQLWSLSSGRVKI